MGLGNRYSPIEWPGDDAPPKLQMQYYLRRAIQPALIKNSITQKKLGEILQMPMSSLLTYFTSNKDKSVMPNLHFLRRCKHADWGYAQPVGEHGRVFNEVELFYGEEFNPYEKELRALLKIEKEKIHDLEQRLKYKTEEVERLYGEIAKLKARLSSA